MDDRALSKRLSYLLRHAPYEAGLTLENGGWVPLEPVLRHLRVSREQVERVVAENDKGRFSLRSDQFHGVKVRANQGHSVAVDLELQPQEPPLLLYHGTHTGAVAAIVRGGLKPMGRHHVHLSADRETARKVGARRGTPVVLTINAAQMQAAGCTFYCSENGVWLVSEVGPTFILLS